MAFVGIILSILSVMYGYITFRLTKMLPLAPWGHYLLWFWLALCWLTTPIPIYFRLSNMESRLVDLLSWFIYLNLGLFSTLFVLLIFHDVGLLIVRVLSHVFSFHFPELGFLQFLNPAKNRAIIVCGIALIISIIGFFKATAIPGIKTVQIPIQGLSKDLEDLKIVQITDIHIGPTIKKPFLEGVVRKINELNPDIVVLTGDLVDGSVTYLEKDVYPLKSIQAPYGKYFVTGNHEYYSGVTSWIKEVENLDFKVLDHDYELLDFKGHKILMAGVPDHRGGNFETGHISDPAKIKTDSLTAELKIILAHQPKSINQSSKAGFDIQLSGHTHGGQYFPWNFVAEWANGYRMGLHKHENTWIYVSMGTGYWGPPLRFGTTQEITLIKLIKE